jgi:hypothetical protein
LENRIPVAARVVRANALGGASAFPAEISVPDE